MSQRPPLRTPAELARARLFLDAFIASGLFLPDWYLATNPDLAVASVKPLEHFIQAGWRENRRPNPMFDCTWYLQRYPDVASSGMNPLVHYWQYGEKEDRQPHPHFDTEWYKAAHKSEIGSASALAHFIRNRPSRRLSPNRLFDVAFYLDANPDVADAQIDPYEHFITTGYREGRNPSREFDIAFYMRTFMHGDKRDPITHYFEVGKAAGYATRPSEYKPTQASEIRRFSSKAPEFEEFASIAAAGARLRGKAIAFYLPQFHSFPENDGWWGTGFTEWTNVARGTPRFEGHFQPRIPRDLGFYDLTSPNVIEKQIQLAKASGIHGFCFYYYNFDGKRLLERPLERFLASSSMEFPFCLLWANENWTRRWDGLDSEVLVEQNYRDTDAVALVDDIARHFADPRYIRADGRPLFILYRPDVVPNISATLALWRQLFENRHRERPLILMAQGFGNTDPRSFGFDGAIEFPPHKVANNVKHVNSSLRFFDPAASAAVLRYDDVATSATNEPPPEFPLIKTVFPSWDNDARRQGHGMVITGSSPQKYEGWLGEALRFANKNPFFGETFVFINAWNEWAEGAYLEPDVHYGSAYLNATARALVGASLRGGRQRLLLVGHDAHPHGAQMLLLHIGRTLKAQFGFDVTFLLCEGGELVAEYEQVGPTVVCDSTRTVQSQLATLDDAKIDTAITNTVASGLAVPALKAAGYKIVSLIHELPKIVREKGLKPAADIIADLSDDVVFPAEFVRSEFERTIREVRGNSIVRPQGIYHQVGFVPSAQAGVREELGLDPNARLVVNVGYADLRKGVDLFCRLAQLVGREVPDAKFVWIGHVDPIVSEWFKDNRAFANVIFAGHRRDVDRVLSAADMFALTSREDPFPSVVLEALSLGLPVVGFDDAGGFSDLLRNEPLGLLAPYCDVDTMADMVTRHLKRRPVGRNQHYANDFQRRFSFDNYAFWLASQGSPIPKVSVIVPNYNYEQYIKERLVSIFDQTHPVFEVIVLDDASTDRSIATIQETADFNERVVKLVRNERNSGSVFAQWRRGLELARGDLVWIAEADDLAERSFLARLCQCFADSTTSFAFADSIPIDGEGRPLGRDYKDYYAHLGSGTLSTDVEQDAGSFARQYLAQRNVILNVSGVVWRRDVLSRAMDSTGDELLRYKLAGDWLLYVRACLEGGKVGYCATPLNIHRRHQKGVTSQTVATKHLEEVSQIHAVFNSSFGTNEGTIALQEQYMRELRQQFQLDTVGY